MLLRDGHTSRLAAGLHGGLALSYDRAYDAVVGKLHQERLASAIVFERDILPPDHGVCVVAAFGRPGTDLMRAREVSLGERAWSAKPRFDGTGYRNEVSRYLGLRLR